MNKPAWDEYVAEQLALAKELAKRKKISGNVCNYACTMICKSGVEFMQFKRLEEMREEFINELTEVEFKVFYKNLHM